MVACHLCKVIDLFCAGELVYLFDLTFNKLFQPLVIRIELMYFAVPAAPEKYCERVVCNGMNECGPLP